MILCTFRHYVCCGVRTVQDSCVWLMTCVTHAGTELWRFDTFTRGWKQLIDKTVVYAGVPSGRTDHAMTSVGLDLWLYGGEGDGEGE